MGSHVFKMGIQQLINYILFTYFNKNQIVLIILNENLKYFNNIHDILLFLHENKELFNNVYIIGGNKIYNLFLDLHILIVDITRRID